MQWFFIQSKLSLMFAKTQLFPHKTAYFLNDFCDSRKKSHGNSKFHITKLILFKKFFKNNE